MITLFSTYKDICHERLNSVLSRHIAAPFEIGVTENGKPFIEGNPLFFSLSHSGERAVFAVGDIPLGIDLEILKERNRESLISRFSERERAEITCERDFLIHWTAREAYVKLFGLTIAKMWKCIEFFGGILYVNGNPQDLYLQIYDLGYGVATLCGEQHKDA